MIFNMVGGGVGGAGGGATLVVSSPANVSVTVSKDDKSYTKNSGDLGSTTFKGLATGTWTVVISGNGQTATRTIEITADYAITIAFFAATINITYPANSTCSVTNSTGQTVASDTNTTSSAKTWTATVGATGTYTVTATATDGSGNSKSQSVSITSDGQSESVELNYAVYIFQAGVGLSSDYEIKRTNADSDSGYAISENYIEWADNTAVGNQFYLLPMLDCSEYSQLVFDFKCTGRYSSSYAVTVGVGANKPSGESNKGTFVASVADIYSTTQKEYSVDLSSVTDTLYVKFCADGVKGYIYNIYLI